MEDQRAVAGAMTLIGRAIDLLVDPTLGNMAQVAPLLEAAIASVRAGDWSGEPERMRRELKTCSRLLHNAAVARLGASAFLYDGTGQTSLLAAGGSGQTGSLRVEA